MTVFLWIIRIINKLKAIFFFLLDKLFGSKTSNFENEVLQVHNEYRREHGVPPLVLNKDICKICQKWAEELAKRDSMAYSLNQTYGESVYCGPVDPNVTVRARDCVDKWYSEILYYSFDKEPEVLNSGHFTQIVWKDTKELGIGSAKSESGKLYVVAYYYPPGNYSGQFTENVLPPGDMQFRSTLTTLSPNKSMSWSELIKKLNSIYTNKIDKYENFKEDCLSAHNEYRRIHGVPPLVLSKKICEYAEEWAKTILRTSVVEHRDQNEYGENLFYACSSDPDFVLSGKEPVDNWYSEIKDYIFDKEPVSLEAVQETGHFTQVIWEDTKELGVGLARSEGGCVYVVANYYPPGNTIGSFTQKVPPPIQ